MKKKIPVTETTPERKRRGATKEREETGPEARRVSCILRYLGRARGGSTVSIIVSEREAVPFAPWIVTGARLPIHREIADLTSRSARRIHSSLRRTWPRNRSDNSALYLLSFARCICLDQLGDNARGIMAARYRCGNVE